MQKHTITPSRPAPSRIESSQASDADAQVQPRQRQFLGTAFLMDKAQRWGHRRLLALILALFMVPLLGLCVLVTAAAPFIAYFFTASGNYQPMVLVKTDLYGAPGETDAQGIRHATTLILTYSDHLTLVEIPAGDAKRATTLATTFVQHGENPRIESASLADMGRKAQDLIVKVSMNWQSLTPETYTYDFANHPELLSTTPGTAGYTAAQFGLVSVTKEA